MTCTDGLEVVERAAVCEDLFGDLAAVEEEALRLLGARYRELGKSVHPDRHRGDAHRVRRAHEAFLKLSRLKSEAERKLRAGSYGDRRRVDVVTVTSGRRAYRVGDVVATGDVCE